MAIGQEAGGGSGIALLVGAEIVYAIVAAACSSPQTAEINAHSRAGTLMKWVHVGMAQSAIFLVLAMAWDRKHAAPIATGGVVAGALMYGSYVHAKKAGLASSKPGTESYSWGSPT